MIRASKLPAHLVEARLPAASHVGASATTNRETRRWSENQPIKQYRARGSESVCVRTRTSTRK